MAKVLFTAVVAELRGKLAGTVFTKNRGGAVARTKVSPTNNRTTARQNARANLARISGLWRTLTQAQQDGWAALAPFYPRTDQFGNKKNPSGQQLFVSSNTTLATVGLGPLMTAPIFEETSWQGTPDVFVAVTGSGAPKVEMRLAGVATSVNVKFLVRATPVVSAGINNADGKYKVVAFGVVEAADTDITTEYLAIYGPLKAGGKIFFELTPYNETTGQKGVPMVLVATT